MIPQVITDPWPRPPGSSAFPPHYLLPGDIPGLLYPCAPVIHRDGWGGIVYDASGLGGVEDVHVAGSGCGMGADPPKRVRRADLALILDSFAGRAFALRWLAEREGLSWAEGCTWVGGFRGMGWTLDCPASPGASIHHRSRTWTPTTSTWMGVRVAALDDLDPGDDRPLAHEPSVRAVNVEALRRVALFVAERS